MNVLSLLLAPAIVLAPVAAVSPLPGYVGAGAGAVPPSGLPACSSLPAAAGSWDGTVLPPTSVYDFVGGSQYQPAHGGVLVYLGSAAGGWGFATHGANPATTAYTGAAALNFGTPCLSNSASATTGVLQLPSYMFTVLSATANQRSSYVLLHDFAFRCSASATGEPNYVGGEVGTTYDRQLGADVSSPGTVTQGAEVWNPLGASFTAAALTNPSYFSWSAGTPSGSTLAAVCPYLVSVTFKVTTRGANGVVGPTAVWSWEATGWVGPSGWAPPAGLPDVDTEPPISCPLEDEGTDFISWLQGFAPAFVTWFDCLWTPVGWDRGGVLSAALGTGFGSWVSGVAALFPSSSATCGVVGPPSGFTLLGTSIGASVNTCSLAIPAWLQQAAAALVTLLVGWSLVGQAFRIFKGENPKKPGDPGDAIL